MHLLQLGLLVAMVVRPAGVQQWDDQHQMAQTLVWRADAEPRTHTPRAPSPNDPCDELYRAGVLQVNRDDPLGAVGTLTRLYSECPNSKYVPEALYWIAFAYNRAGIRDNNISNFREGLGALRLLRQRFPKDFKRGDGRALEQRILGELARRGDPEAARAIVNQGKRIAQERGQQTDTNCDAGNPNAQVDDVKIAALNALMQMNATQALPSLQAILSRRDKGSVCLRRAAVLLVAQRLTDGVEATLLSSARTDPDLEVRKRAVLYLSQFNTDRAFSALDSIVHEVRDSELVESAVLALSQSDNPRARAALRAYAERDDLPESTQRRVIMLLLQRGPSAADPIFLQKIYKRTDPKDIDIRRSIIQALWSMMPYGDSAAGRWFLGVARDNSEAVELRIEALAKAAELGPIKSRIKLYTPKLDRQLREQVIAAYSPSRIPQNGDAVLDDLAEIAKRDPDSDLRRRAIDRISQSNTPHAAEVLRDIINEP